MEIRDNLSVSKFKKFMYMYSSEDVPRQTYADMVRNTNNYILKMIVAQKLLYNEFKRLK